MDVDISSSSTGASAKLTSSKGTVEFIKDQDINNAAIKEEMEEQFIVPVDGNTKISNSGDSNVESAVESAVATSTAPSVTASAPVGVVTVTVTAPGAMTTITVTADPSESSSSAQGQQSSASPTRRVAPVVTPFLTATPSSKAGKKISTVTEVVEETVTETQTMVMQSGGALTALPQSGRRSVPRIRGRAPRGF